MCMLSDWEDKSVMARNWGPKREDCYFGGSSTEYDIMMKYAREMGLWEVRIWSKGHIRQGERELRIITEMIVEALWEKPWFCYHSLLFGFW